MATSVFTAAKALRMKKINILAAYNTDITRRQLVPILEAEGLEISKLNCLELDRDEDVWKVRQDQIQQRLEQLTKESPDVDGTIICCSVLRVCSPGFIDELERSTGKPIVTSMQAFMWDMLRTVGENKTIPGYGKLFGEPNNHPVQQAPLQMNSATAFALFHQESEAEFSHYQSDDESAFDESEFESFFEHGFGCGSDFVSSNRREVDEKLNEPVNEYRRCTTVQVVRNSLLEIVASNKLVI